MANVHIDYTELQNSATRLSAAQRDVEDKLNQLKTMIDNLVATGFVTDQASGRFQQSYEQWTTGARNVIGGLDGMTQFLRAAVSQHQNLDSQLGNAAGN
ncbi:WXG100 family type VII secretion target [Actinoplanes sp. NPDC049265]|uniref:WXG100 family type VII secretion target n=1 Tax=Actinoplanes sp. NPDC049265 TaxID=3363902 RepID=UPI0037177ECB